MQIQAKVSENTLSKVTRLFNASLNDILNELLQNERRAGATQVKVEVNEDYLSITDDGVGINDPSILLTLGNSDWEEETQEREDPAGMGIFSLANRTAEVRSRDWFVHLTPAHFRGELPATVKRTQSQIGTTVIFRLEEGEATKLNKILSHAAKYYPLPVEFNGTRVEQKDFLEGAAYIEQWRGLKMGVVADYYSCLEVINFHGITLSHDLPRIEQVGQYSSRLGVKIDVVNCPDLKLVLPARKELVQNPFLLELYDEVRRVIYRYLRTLEFHQLSHVLWEEASSLGVTLPEAKPALLEYKPSVADHHAVNWAEEIPVMDNNTLIIDTEDLNSDQQQVFWREFGRANLPYTPVQRQPGYKGYTWYDQLPMLSEIEFEIVIDDKQFTPEQPEVEYGSNKVEVDDIVITATINQPDGSSTQQVFSTDLHLYQVEDSYSMEEVTIFLKRGHTVKVDELADLLKASYFFPSDDGEADSYDTQEEGFEEFAHLRATEILLSSEEAFLENFRSRLNEIRWMLPEGARAEISMSQEGITIQIHQGE